MQQAKIKGFVFHGLRHYYCSMGGEIGASGIQLRAQVGHSSSKMTGHYSHLEADATRLNAQLSTGPNTDKGKKIACHNSIKHGLLSKNLLVLDEEENELFNFRERIYETISPVGSVEEFLVKKMIMFLGDCVD